MLARHAGVEKQSAVVESDGRPLRNALYLSCPAFSLRLCGLLLTDFSPAHIFKRTNVSSWFSLSRSPL